jgi:hypothetical protein
MSSQVSPSVSGDSGSRITGIEAGISFNSLAHVVGYLQRVPEVDAAPDAHIDVLLSHLRDAAKLPFQVRICEIGRSDGELYGRLPAFEYAN